MVDPKNQQTQRPEGPSIRSDEGGTFFDELALFFASQPPESNPDGMRISNEDVDPATLTAQVQHEKDEEQKRRRAHTWTSNDLEQD